jgi:hypothetical protein
MLGMEERQSQRNGMRMHADGRRKGQIPRFQAFPSPCLAGGSEGVRRKTLNSFLINLDLLGFRLVSQHTSLPTEPQHNLAETDRVPDTTALDFLR